MDARNVFFTWKKGERVQLSEFFATHEFECRCNFKECVEQKISLELVRRLDRLRKGAGSTVRIHSAYRCAAKQQQLRDDADQAKKENIERAKAGLPPLVTQLTVVATTTSTHELGFAADVSCSKLTIPALLPQAALQFKSIGIALNFLHLDLRDDKERRWKY